MEKLVFLLLIMNRWCTIGRNLKHLNNPKYMPSENSYPIDAVITWVDGQDPKHLQKLNAYIASIGGQRPRTADPTRFHDDGEISYCVISLLKYAPWLRHIYIVTDDQVPNIINQLKGTQWEEKVKLVDHKEIFIGHEHVLPTFNARSIITMVWRIPGLSERFLFLNDDFFLIRPVNPDNFFHDHGIVVRGEWRDLEEKRWTKKLRKFILKYIPKTKGQKLRERVKYRDAQKNSARLSGFTNKYFFLNHEPRPWRKSTTQAFFEKNPDVFLSNISHRLRSSTQFLCELLAIFLEIKAGSVIYDPLSRSVEIDPPQQTEEDIKRIIKVVDEDKDYLFVCVQSLEKADPELRKYIVEWLDRRIGPLIG